LEVALRIRDLTRSEVEKVWEIDRREVVNAVYYLEGGELVLRPEHYDMQGWPAGEREIYAPILADCFDRGGTFYGAFNDAGQLVATVDSSLQQVFNQDGFQVIRTQHHRWRYSCAWKSRL
jgi:predicted N-acetyltransferase YhbS